MNIREAQLTDRDEIAHLCKQVLLEFYKFEANREFLYDLEHLGEAVSLYDQSQKGGFVVAVQEGKIVACAGLRKLCAGEAVFAVLGSREEIGELTKVYVLQQFRSQGIGRRLWEYLRAAALKLGYSALYLNASGLLGVDKFWQKLGFQPILEEQDRFQTKHFIYYLY